VNHIQYVMIRRLKKDVLHDLPGKIRQVLRYKIHDAEIQHVCDFWGRVRGGKEEEEEEEQEDIY
jgi:hypothetical protein